MCVYTLYHWYYVCSYMLHICVCVFVCVCECVLLTTFSTQLYFSTQPRVSPVISCPHREEMGQSLVILSSVTSFSSSHGCSFRGGIFGCVVNNFILVYRCIWGYITLLQWETIKHVSYWSNTQYWKNKVKMLSN